MKQAIGTRQDSRGLNESNEEKKRSSTENKGQHKESALLSLSVAFLCYLGRVECLAF